MPCARPKRFKQAGSHHAVWLKISLRISGLTWHLSCCKVHNGDVQVPQSGGSMNDKAVPLLDRAAQGVSRRNFIKGVICGGAAVSSAGYLFRASNIFGQSGNASDRLITINVNGQQRRVNAMK